MKPELKRIEATLHQLRTISTASYPERAEQRLAHAPQTRNRTYSFEIRSDTQKPAHKEPTLPKFNSRSSSHRNVSNPAFKMHLLPEQTDVATLVAQLQQIVRQIQDIYHEGPIVDGWLESNSCTPERGAVTLRGESVDRPIDYVEEGCSFEQGKVTCESPRAGYRLSGLDAAGQKWSRPCPLEQLPSVSIAIARYQKLQQLLERKQYLETRLSQMQDQCSEPNP